LSLIVWGLGYSLVEKSPANVNEDLHGYFEIYEALKPMDLIEAIKANKMVELSPPQVLFLLEFEMVTRPDGQFELIYKPQRFFHRYARSSSLADKEYSNQILSAEFKKGMHTYLHWLELWLISWFPVPRIFLGRIENGRSHASCAKHMTTVDGDELFICLDSLRPGPVSMESAYDFVASSEFGGTASVMIVPDETRPQVSLGVFTL